MATQKQPTKDKSKALAQSEPGASDVALLTNEELAELGQHSSKGMESVKTSDLAMPFLTILQALSPQVKEGGGEHVEGAKPGLIFNTVTNALYDKIIVVPASYKTRYTEWKPRDSGGGLVRDWGEDGSMYNKLVPDDRGRRITPTGTNIVESATIFGLLYPSQERVIIAFSSTQRKKGRSWLTQAHNIRLDDGKGGKFNPPFFFMTYELSVISENNQKGDWYGWRITPHQPTRGKNQIEGGPSIFAEALKLAEDVNSKKVSAPVALIGNEVKKDDDEIPF